MRCRAFSSGKAVGALQGALCSCMERFVESGCGSGRSGVVRLGKVSRGLVGRVLVWQLRQVKVGSVPVSWVLFRCGLFGNGS